MSEKRQRTKLVNVRLTPEEYARAQQKANGLPLGAYIRWRLLDPDAPPPRTRNKTPVRDHQILSQLLGDIGRSHAASNLNQLARSANSGSLNLDPDTLALLRGACRAIIATRDILMKALGLMDDAP